MYMTDDFQFGSGGQTPAEPNAQPSAPDGMPSLPQQPEMPPVPPVNPYQGNSYTPPAPAAPSAYQPPAGGTYSPGYGAQPGYTYNGQQPRQPQQPYTYYQQQNGYAAPYYPPPAVQSAPGNGYAVASLILGIVSVLVSCSLFLTLPCAVVGLILGIVGKSKGAGGMAVAGIILSALGLLIAIALIVLVVVTGGFTYWVSGTNPYVMSSFIR